MKKTAKIAPQPRTRPQSQNFSHVCFTFFVLSNVRVFVMGFPCSHLEREIRKRITKTRKDENTKNAAVTDFTSLPSLPSVQNSSLSSRRLHAPRNLVSKFDRVRSTSIGSPAVRLVSRPRTNDFRVFVMGFPCSHLEREITKRITKTRKDENTKKRRRHGLYFVTFLTFCSKFFS